LRPAAPAFLAQFKFKTAENHTYSVRNYDPADCGPQHRLFWHDSSSKQLKTILAVSEITVLRIEARSYGFFGTAFSK
jgi:hypothetical protein